MKLKTINEKLSESINFYLLLRKIFVKHELYSVLFKDSVNASRKR